MGESICGKLKIGRFRDRETSDEGTQIFIIPLGVQLTRALSYYRDEAIPCIIDSAINATSGSKVSILGHLHPDLVDKNDLGVEVVRAVHKVIRVTNPDLLELSKTHFVTKVEAGRKCLHIVMKPIVG